MCGVHEKAIRLFLTSQILLPQWIAAVATRDTRIRDTGCAIGDEREGMKVRLWCDDSIPFYQAVQVVYLLPCPERYAVDRSWDWCRYRVEWYLQLYDLVQRCTQLQL